MQLMPELEGQEQNYVAEQLVNMTEQQQQTFVAAYRAQRKTETNVLLLTLVGFAGVAGLNRFYLGQMGMGILYLLTGGLCLIGTIIDLIKHKELAFEYNSQKAQELAGQVQRHA